VLCDVSGFSDSADIVVRKGCNPKVDSYSGFGDSTGGTLEKTELLNVLDEHGIRHVFVVGLATDYCVSFTAKDAAKAGTCARVCIVRMWHALGQGTLLALCHVL